MAGPTTSKAPERSRARVPDATRAFRPVTERVLDRLPGPRVLRILAWALVPWLNAGANLLLETGSRSAIWDQSRTLIVLNYAALSFAIAITLWGTERIARRVETLPETAWNALDIDARERFREIDSVAGPLLASAAAALAFAVSALVADGWTAALLRGVTLFVVGVALWGFLWTYGSLQLGLVRLGAEPLAPDAGRLDPTLGVRPLGGLAFMGLWMLLAWVVPVLLTALSDTVLFAIGMAVLGGAVATFFLSLVRLHHRMVEAKATEVDIARELYAEAYEPIRDERTLVALERQHRLLAAADALDKRAQAIHEWPIDEGTVARVITIVSSVIAVIIARLILDPFGL